MLKMNRSFRHAMVYAALAAGALSYSCGNSRSEVDLSKVADRAVMQVPMYSRSGIAAATGDFDNDGKLDFILAAQQPVNFVHPPLDVYFVSNSGGGKYASPRVVAQLPMRAQSGAALATGDFDNDGKLDFLVAAQQPGSIDHMPATVYVFMNQGNAVFSKR